MIKLAPNDNFSVEISLEGQSFGIFEGEALTEAMEGLHAEYPGQCELICKSDGYKATAGAVNKALELAGLEGLQAAKAQASGKIQF